MRNIFLMIIFMISCSDFQEQEQILDYEEYIYQGWNAFETVNLNELSQDNTNAYYYELALDMFTVSLQAIDYEFTSQGFVGPAVKSYNGIGWTQLYYASEFLEPSVHYIRDSLRQESKISFDNAYNNLIDDSDLLTTQDSCNTYSGLAYINYYLGFDNSDFESSLNYSDALLNIKSDYHFEHDELDFRNIHYLRGKIYLFQEDYSQACIEIDQANNCDCDSNNVDIDILLDCFNQFSNGE